MYVARAFVQGLFLCRDKRCNGGWLLLHLELIFDGREVRLMENDKGRTRCSSVAIGESGFIMNAFVSSQRFVGWNRRASACLQTSGRDRCVEARRIRPSLDF